MKITRQHESTTIEELNSTECVSLLGIGPGGEQGYYAWYLKANNTWYRFFIQHGILFWDTAAPDPEDDLAEGEGYREVIDDGWPKDERYIAKILMDEGCLTIDFNGGRSLIVEENEEMGCMTVKKT
jgi:hypothetical protein